MKLSDFYYHLPQDRIALFPARPRDSSRLMVLAAGDPPTHSTFRALPKLLSKGDLLVLNDTRVRPVRIRGFTAGGGEAEVFLLKPTSDGRWEAMVRPGKRLLPGKIFFFADRTGRFKILKDLGGGKRLVSQPDLPPGRSLLSCGDVPLPPYIKRPPERADTIRYQTVFAREGFSVAAPTAGLHFTARVLRDLSERGVEVAKIRLDVGPGTFKPVTSERIEEHIVDPENYSISISDSRAINRALERGSRIIAVGTTVARTLEDQVGRFGAVRDGNFETSLFIYPGHRFKAIVGLITNFHLPCSSLLMLVSAFSTRERVLSAYHEAVVSGYRFYSYGDAMLLWGCSPR